MSILPSKRPDLGTGHRRQHPLVERRASFPSPGVVTTAELMGSGQGLTVPRLDRIPVEHSLSAADEPCINLAKTLLKLDIAVPGDWEKAKRDPTAYVGLTLTNWIAKHGSDAIRRRFDLTAALTSCLDDYGDREPGNPNLLYLTVDAGSAGYVVFGPTLELLEHIHPRLPVTFYNLFTGALNKWIRTYDFRDAQERVLMLREWIEGEPDEEQYEIPDVDGCIPPCMKHRPLGDRALQQAISRAEPKEAKEILQGVYELAQLSKQADRPELTDEMREEMSDMNPPLPGLLAVFKTDDAIEGSFDEEAQAMLECTPESSLTLPLIADQPESLSAAFQTLRIVCDTLAAASRLIDQMPGNDQWVIRRGNDGSAGEDRR